MDFSGKICVQLHPLPQPSSYRKKYRDVNRSSKGLRSTSLRAVRHYAENFERDFLEEQRKLIKSWNKLERDRERFREDMYFLWKANFQSRPFEFYDQLYGRFGESVSNERPHRKRRPRFESRGSESSSQGEISPRRDNPRQPRADRHSSAGTGISSDPVSASRIARTASPADEEYCIYPQSYDAAEVPGSHEARSSKSNESLVQPAEDGARHHTGTGSGPRRTCATVTSSNVNGPPTTSGGSSDGPPPPASRGADSLASPEDSMAPGSNQQSGFTKTPATHNFCAFCYKNSAPYDHPMLDAEGKVVCPIRRLVKCKSCRETGDDAHCVSYCPYKKKRRCVECSSKVPDSKKDIVKWERKALKTRPPVLKTRKDKKRSTEERGKTSDEGLANTSESPSVLNNPDGFPAMRSTAGNGVQKSQNFLEKKSKKGSKKGPRPGDVEQRQEKCPGAIE